MGAEVGVACSAGVGVDAGAAAPQQRRPAAVPSSSAAQPRPVVAPGGARCAPQQRPAAAPSSSASSSAKAAPSSSAQQQRTAAAPPGWARCAPQRRGECPVPQFSALPSVSCVPPWPGGVRFAPPGCPAPGFPVSVGQLPASNTTATRGRALAPCRVAIGIATEARRVGTIQLRTSQPRCPSRAPPSAVAGRGCAFSSRCLGSRCRRGAGAAVVVTAPAPGGGAVSGGGAASPPAGARAGCCCFHDDVPGRRGAAAALAAVLRARRCQPRSGEGAHAA